LALGRRTFWHGWKLGQFDVEFVVGSHGRPSYLVKRISSVVKEQFFFTLHAVASSTATLFRRFAGWARR
jgi:hypothetical protein